MSVKTEHSRVLPSMFSGTIACSGMSAIIAATMVVSPSCAGVIEIGTPTNRVNADEITCITFSTDDTQIVAGTKNGFMVIWDMKTKKSLSMTRICERELSKISIFSTKNSTVLICWDVVGQHYCVTPSLQPARFPGIAKNAIVPRMPRNSKLLYRELGKDGWFVMDLQTQLSKPLPGVGKIDDIFLVSGNTNTCIVIEEKKLRVVDLQSNSERFSWPIPKQTSIHGIEVSFISLSRPGNVLGISYWEPEIKLGTLAMVDTTNGQIIHSAENILANGRFAVCDRANLIAFSKQDGTHVVSLNSKASTHISHNNEATSFAFSHQSNQIAIGSNRRTLYLADLP